MAAGLRVLPRSKVIDAEIVARFQRLPVANVSDSMARMSAAGARLRPMHKGGAMAGAALTVKTRPGDNLMIHKAIRMAAPGDVLVVDGGGDLSNSLMGEMMLMQLVRIGVVGVVLNGAIRDAAYIAGQTLPVFAAGITHRGPYKNGPGEINVPVAIDGMVVEPGDLVIGDDDGLLAVSIADAPHVLAAAEAKYAAEQKQMAEIDAGTYDGGWVDATLRQMKCEGVE